MNNFFRKLIKTEWVSGIDIDKRREAEIKSCFDNEAEFHKTIKEPDELVDLIEKIKLRTIDLIDNINDAVFGEKISMDRHIVMDKVSGVADNCKKFAEFLTVCRKYKFCLKQIFLIFSLRVYLTILYQKYYKVTIDRHEKNIFWHVLYSYIGSLLALLIQTKDIA